MSVRDLARYLARRWGEIDTAGLRHETHDAAKLQAARQIDFANSPCHQPHHAKPEVEIFKKLSRYFFVLIPY